MSPALAGGFFTTQLPGKPHSFCIWTYFSFHRVTDVLINAGSELSSVEDLEVTCGSCP